MSPSRKPEPIHANAAERVNAARLLAMSLQPGPDTLANTNPNGRRFCAATCPKLGIPQRHLGYSDDFTRCAELAQARADALQVEVCVMIWQPTDDGGYWSSGAAAHPCPFKGWQRTLFVPGGEA